MSVTPHGNFSLSAWAAPCSESLQWSDAVGRCVTSDEAAKIQNASGQCEGLGTQELKKKCYNDAIQARIDQAEADGTIYAHQKVDPSITSIILNLAALVAAFKYFPKKGGDCSMAFSAWAIIGGALAVIAGEVYTAIKYKGDLKKANEEVEKVAKDASAGTGSDVQAASFQAMIKREEATINAAKTKKTFYSISTAAYTIALALAVIEGILSVLPYTSPTWQPNTQCNQASFGKGEASRYAFSDEESAPARVQGSLTEIYIDNYFQNNQRVPYSTYFRFASAMDANSLTDVVMQTREQDKVHAGSNISVSYADYERIERELQKRDLKLEREEITVFKFTQKVMSELTIQKSHAADMSLMLLLGAAGPAAYTLITQGSEGLKKLFMSPWTRIAFAGILLANNIFMIKHIDEQIKKAEKRRDFIQELLTQVTAAGAAFGCTTSDRNSNLAKPNCYCYTEAGTLNPSRSNSATCKALFGGKPIASNTNNGGSNPSKPSEPKNCLSSSGTADELCTCRKTNTCASISPKLTPGSVPAGLFGNLSETINGLTNGTLDSQSVDLDALDALAARAKAAQKAMLKKHPKEAKKVKQAEAGGKSYMKALINKINATPGIANTKFNGFGGFDGGTKDFLSKSKLKDQVQQEIKAYQASQAPSVSGVGSGKDGANAMDGILAGEDAVTIMDEKSYDAKLAAVMDNAFNMSDGEIHDNPSVSIFEIVSNRYQRSAIRRLFRGEAMIPADKPSESEVNK